MKEIEKLAEENKRLKCQCAMYRQELESIKDYGFANPGCGYSCANKADKTLSQFEAE